MRRTLLALALLGVTACAPDVRVDRVAVTDDDALVVLVGDGPHRQILEHAAALAAGELTIRIEDAGPDANRRVADGHADAAYFQHVPAFDGWTEQEGIEGLAVLARVHVVPYALYSRTCTSLDLVPHFGSVLMASGQAPLARGLYLLQHAQLLTLNKAFGGTTFEDLTVSESNVVDSERHLTITQADPAQFPEVLDAVDLAVMNPDIARDNGFDPATPLLREPATNNPYANVLVGAADHTGRPGLDVLAHYLQSPEVADFIDAEFGGEVIAADPSRPKPDGAVPVNVAEDGPAAPGEAPSCR